MSMTMDGYPVPMDPVGSSVAPMPSLLRTKPPSLLPSNTVFREPRRLETPNMLPKGPQPKDLDYGVPPLEDPNNWEAQYMRKMWEYERGLMNEGRIYLRRGMIPEDNAGLEALQMAERDAGRTVSPQPVFQAVPESSGPKRLSAAEEMARPPKKRTVGPLFNIATDLEELLPEEISETSDFDEYPFEVSDEAEVLDELPLLSYEEYLAGVMPDDCADQE